MKLFRNNNKISDSFQSLTSHACPVTMLNLLYMPDSHIIDVIFVVCPSVRHPHGPDLPERCDLKSDDAPFMDFHPELRLLCSCARAPVLVRLCLCACVLVPVCLCPCARAVVLVCVPSCQSVPSRQSVLAVPSPLLLPCTRSVLVLCLCSHVLALACACARVLVLVCLLVCFCAPFRPVPSVLPVRLHSTDCAYSTWRGTITEGVVGGSGAGRTPYSFGNKEPLRPVLPKIQRV